MNRRKPGSPHSGIISKRHGRLCLQKQYSVQNLLNGQSILVNLSSTDLSPQIHTFGNKQMAGYPLFSLSDAEKSGIAQSLEYWLIMRLNSPTTKINPQSTEY